MALFATTEEKELKKKEKEEKEFNKLVERYNLRNLEKEDYQVLKNIASNLAGSGIAEFGMLFSGKTEDRIKIDRLAALQEQNWVIINQLIKLNKNIEKLIDTNKDK